MKGSILCLLGEITHAGPKIDFEKIAREVVKGVGYNDVAMGYDWESVKVIQEID